MESKINKYDERILFSAINAKGASGFITRSAFVIIHFLFIVIILRSGELYTTVVNAGAEDNLGAGLAKALLNGVDEVIKVGR